jgi:hypothetical protein
MFIVSCMKVQILPARSIYIKEASMEVFLIIYFSYAVFLVSFTLIRVGYGGKQELGLIVLMAVAWPGTFVFYVTLLVSGKIKKGGGNYEKSKQQKEGKAKKKTRQFD